MSPIIQAGVQNHMGRLRTNNEDNFFLNGYFMKKAAMDAGASIAHTFREPSQLYAVCDGMGGEEAGEEASFAAVKAMKGLALKLLRAGEIKSEIDAYTAEANRAILSLTPNARAGSTLAMLLFLEKKALIAYLGDSRVYLYRNGRINLLTQDHTETQRLKNLGLITDEEALRHPGRNALTRNLGMDIEGLVVRPTYIDDIVPQKEDVFLICSDGLSDMLDQEHIERILRSAWGKDVCDLLVSAALEAGGKDNITVLTARVLEI